MSYKKDEQIMLIISIIERGKAKAYMDMLGKKDILRAVDHHAVDHGRAAHTRLPEGQIEHVMKAKGN